jgi:hypothetical protein
MSVSLNILLRIRTPNTQTSESAPIASLPTVAGTDKLVTPAKPRVRMLPSKLISTGPDDPPVAVTCSACGHPGFIHTWDRFPTLRWCHSCVRKLQYTLFLTCGFIPPLPFLVLDHTWKTGPNNHTLIPPGVDGILQASQAYSTQFATRGTPTQS